MQTPRHHSNQQQEGEEAKALYKYGDYKSVYPFGIDPAWHLSDNSLLFLNSLKVSSALLLLKDRKGDASVDMCVYAFVAWSPPDTT